MTEHEAQTEAKTIYDKVYEYAAQATKPFPVKDIQDAFGLTEPILRDLLEVFTNSRVLDVKQNRVVRVNPPYGLVGYENVEPSKTLEERTFEVNSLKFQVKVVKVANEIVPVYYIPPLKIGNGLRTRIKSIFNNLSRSQTTSGKVSGDIDLSHQEELTKSLAVAAIEKEINARQELAERLADMMIYEFSEVGCLRIFLADKDIEEVVFNGVNAVSLYSCRYGWVKTNVTPTGENALFEIASRMARLVQKEINFSNPIVETRLDTGDRVNTLLSTVSPQGTIITIRKFARNPWTIVGLIKELSTTTLDIGALLWFAVEYDLNILLAGGSGSGKTTLLNAVCNLIPPSVHVLSVETVREIHIPESRAWNWLSLVSRNEPNAESITTTDLIEVSLKMRPERIVLGEAVLAPDIRALFQCMQVGHPVYSTIHATSSNELLQRVMDPVYAIPRTDLNAMDLILVMYHDISEKSRKLIEVSEIIYDETEKDFLISRMQQWSQKAKVYIETAKPKKIFRKVAMKTGMNEADMLADIEEKKKVLTWAIENNIADMSGFEVVVQEYYSNKKALLERINTGKPVTRPTG